MLTKFEPVTVRVKAGPPAVALEGFSLVMPGTGLLMGYDAGLEAPPSLVGSLTTMLAVPAVEMSFPGTVAVSSVLLTKVVCRFEPFHCTVAGELKPVPFTVRVNVGPPAVALGGEREVIVG